MTPVLSVTDLQVRVDRNGSVTMPVRGVSFTVNRAQRLGVIGESGSGKTLTALAVMGLLPPRVKVDGGQITLDGVDLATLRDREMARIRGKRISMVYQDPMSALNPLQTVGKQLVEAITTHMRLSRAAAWDRALSLIDEVGIREPSRRIKSYPHEFSGGMRQRVVIAMAMACNPDILIADEPTSALDVTTQKRVMDSLMRMTSDHGTSVILITHDLGLAAEFCDDIQVMYAGRIVERGPAADLQTQPLHPYPEALLTSICTLSANVDEPLEAIQGQPPSPSDFPTGCAFHPRCRYVISLCSQVEPLLSEIGDSGRWAACHLANERAASRNVS
jgi:peptide/nickel transport system ATP-binding protein